MVDFLEGGRTDLQPHSPIDRTARGRTGEQAAAAFLAERGYRILAMNQRTPAGEIDIICRDAARGGGQIVMVEVKARSGRAFGTPLEAIGPHKARRLRAAAVWWLAGRRLLPCPLRFDVVAVELDGQGQPCTLSHLRDAIDGGL